MIKEDYAENIDKMLNYFAIKKYLDSLWFEAFCGADYAFYYSGIFKGNKFSCIILALHDIIW